MNHVDEKEIKTLLDINHFLIRRALEEDRIADIADLLTHRAILKDTLIEMYEQKKEAD